MAVKNLLTGAEEGVEEYEHLATLVRSPTRSPARLPACLRSPASRGADPQGFNSKRKRVTMIYRRGNTIHVRASAAQLAWFGARPCRAARAQVMSKGADSVALPLVANWEDHSPVELSENLVEMARNGLRTLVLLCAEKTEAWWQQWRPKFEAAVALPEVDQETKHQKGACLDGCRICQCFNDMCARGALGPHRP
jgi:hypothetical protein